MKILSVNSTNYSQKSNGGNTTFRGRLLNPEMIPVKYGQFRQGLVKDTLNIAAETLGQKADLKIIEGDNGGLLLALVKDGLQIGVPREVHFEQGILKIGSCADYLISANAQALQV